MTQSWLCRQATGSSGTPRTGVEFSSEEAVEVGSLIAEQLSGRVVEWEEWEEGEELRNEPGEAESDDHGHA